MPTLRERKRERTRQAILDAAVALFERDGYEATTVADIAAAADIGTRTFFGYFASKEDLLFPGGDERVAAAVTAITERGPADRPADVLIRALRTVDAAGHGFVDRQAAVRRQVMRSVPAVHAAALMRQLEAQREIAGHLAAAYPDELDDVTASALVGAFIGAVTGAADALARHPDREDGRAAFLDATDRALRPWMR
ncbi:hypothetical protein GCM10009836_58640 [Pseudonocardia ailaonensis]|uniref:HTH tetR-type domain-containing protein n=1 Tax=Pseudonocardia ailaonensis TaxID=367279 RepID=A0ABN2NI61_9PSEU